MSKPSEVKAIVDGGKASAGPPLGPALGPLGVNVKQVIEAINKSTKGFIGMKVPVVVKVFPNRTFEIEVKTPTTSALILKEAGVSKGASEHQETTGNISFKALVEIADMKKTDMLAVDLKSAAKEVAGTCLSSGINIDDKKPQEIFKAIDAGEYDSFFK